jgi:DNA-directed RNA polymerase subunit RPC12/RpoP
MIIHCSNPDCRRKFTRNLETDVRLLWEIKFISCPYCGEFIQIMRKDPLEKNVSSKRKA